MMQISSNLNKLKIQEYKKRELELLEKSSKTKITRKSYKEMANELSAICDNIDKYFIIPKRFKKSNKKFIIKEKNI